MQDGVDRQLARTGGRSPKKLICANGSQLIRYGPLGACSRATRSLAKMVGGGRRSDLDCSETHNRDPKIEKSDTRDRVSSRRSQFNDQVIDSHGNGNLSRTCQRGISSNSWR